MNKEITKTLKELKEEILRLKGAMYSDFLLIGLRLKHIKDTGLFKEEYKSFQEFIEGIDIPSTTAYQTIRIVEVFNIKTDEDISRRYYRDSGRRKKKTGRDIGKNKRGGRQ